jgi:group I intron endonuclease
MNFRNRKSRHLKDLKKGIHHSKKLQRSWLKYGEENFIFLILEQDIEINLINREQYWIDFYDSYKNGFNSRPDAHLVPFGNDHHSYQKEPWNKGVKGYKLNLTEEGRRKMSESSKTFCSKRYLHS